MVTAPYGCWESPVDAASVAEGEALVEWLDFVGDEVWWTEARPEDDGRSALMRRLPDGTVTEALPPIWDVRSRVIEYGGRPWLPLGDGVAAGIVFSHLADQRVYRWQPGGEPYPISPPVPDGIQLRYADFARWGDEVWCLRETVADVAGTDVTRHLVALPLAGGPVRVLAASHHFMTGPTVAPDGSRVGWIGWNHPAMPWDGTELMVAPVAPDGTLGPACRLAGGEQESVTQLAWSRHAPANLYAVTDPGGWWNVWEIGPDGQRRNLCPREEEFSDALWRIGLRWMCPLADGDVAVIHGTSGRRLGVLGTDGALLDVDSPYTEFTHLATDGRRLAVVAAGPSHGRTVLLVDPADGTSTVLRSVARRDHDRYASQPYHRTDTGPDGVTVHSHVYPPFHPDVTAAEGELPPYLVFAHGGPTSRTHMIRHQEIMFFTSRGFGVVDVQYGGSTGFGRAYRERLRGTWGEVDVADCATVGRGLIADGLADPDRIAIRGGSAGGWTAVASLVAEPDLYRAAGVYYPVLDLESWRSQGTHDFESRYLDGLVGPWPRERETYRRRSPVNQVDRIRAPLVVLQGLDDTVCPPAQAERLLVGLRGRAVPCRYLTFEGEGHGFRRADTVIRSLHAELELYAAAFAVHPAARTEW